MVLYLDTNVIHQEFPVLLFLDNKSNICTSHLLTKLLTSKDTFWGERDVIKGYKNVFTSSQISFKCHFKCTVTRERYISIHPTSSFISNHWPHQDVQPRFLNGIYLIMGWKKKRKKRKGTLLWFACCTYMASRFNERMESANVTTQHLDYDISICTYGDYKVSCVFFKLLDLRLVSFCHVNFRVSY